MLHVSGRRTRSTCHAGPGKLLQRLTVPQTPAHLIASLPAVLVPFSSRTSTAAVTTKKRSIARARLEEKWADATCMSAGQRAQCRQTIVAHLPA